MCFVPGNISLLSSFLLVAVAQIVEWAYLHVLQYLGSVNAHSFSPVHWQQARQYTFDILEALKLLEKNLDMTLSEVKLTIAIDSPSSKEMRKMGIEVFTLMGHSIFACIVEH